ncbi:hypothetical protein [Flavobacterium sp. TAB 87]|uniref:hypothetical protein n=1 Tax=Flavobacterium sp. TAB 87 TaxID=1729581 RepID=UPI0012F9D5BD|nr:hypothetical protein [Flavobacterium sp. TAB 87]
MSKKTMYDHTLILSTSKIDMPEGVNADFILKIINQTEITTEYFGVELDNPTDYENEEMKAAESAKSFFEFYFSTVQEMEYHLLTKEEARHLLDTLFNTGAKSEIMAGIKDVTIYI